MQPLTEDQKRELEEKYQQLVGFYFNVKKIILKSEKITTQKDRALSAVAINELRNAYDHISRHHLVAVCDELSNVDEGLTPYDYCNKNLSKASGHLYRAGYDAYDIIVNRLTDTIYKVLDDYEPDVLVGVIPDFYQSIHPKIVEAEDESAEAKAKKDVVSEEEEIKAYDQYTSICKNLEKIQKDLYSKIDALEEFKQAKHKNKSKDIVIAIIIALAFFFLGQLCK